MFRMRTAVAFLLSVLVTFVAASATHTHFVLNSFAETGVPVSAGLRLQTTLQDMQGLAPGYGGAIAVALLIAFLVAWQIRRMMPVPTAIAYGLAGAAGMAALLYGMTLVLGGLPLIAGARSDIGFIAQCLAGALGGLIFAGTLPRANP